MTKKYGLLGEKLSHSYSPLIHASLGDYKYQLYEKAADEVEAFLLHGNFDGLNITIPYKKTAAPSCAELSGMARKTGSVNAIVRRRDGSLFGDNTDAYGFAYMLDKLGVDVSGKKVLLLGSGGASSSVHAVLEERGAGDTVVISRRGANNYQNIDRHKDACVVINATPVGMYPNNGAAPVDIKQFEFCEAVLELVYNPASTALMLNARERGIPCINGLFMLVAQAKKASELFQETAIPDSAIDEIADKISRMTQNIVLIGMPGCGKTSIGARLAAITGREFFDTDRMIEEKAGKSVPRVIEEDGEERLRCFETEALREASARSGCVIACGGGIVKKAVNLRHIRQNGAAVFLDRNVGELPTRGRPLSQKTGVAALAAERLPLYRQWSDHTVTVSGVDETALKIKELLGI